VERLERLESRHRSRVDMRREPHRVHGIEPRARAAQGTHTAHDTRGEKLLSSVGFFSLPPCGVCLLCGCRWFILNKPLSQKKRRHSGAGIAERGSLYTLL
jgi:hypothetical protein